MVTKERKTGEIWIGVSVYQEKFGTGAIVDRWGKLIIKPQEKGKLCSRPAKIFLTLSSAELFTVAGGNSCVRSGGPE